MKFTHLLSVAATITVASGCSSAVTEPAPKAPAIAAAAKTSTAAELCDAELGSTEPVHAVGNIYLAGQPQEAELADMAKRGIKTVVTLRKPGELEWDEAAAVEGAGMEFIAVPFDGHEELTDDVFERVRQVLSEHSDAPLVLHCGRANRVGAVWMAHRVLDDGVGIEQALEEAKKAGLRTPEYIDKAQDYIRRAQEEERAAAR